MGKGTRTTLIIISEGMKKVKKISFSRLGLRYTSFFLFVLFCFSVFIIYDYLEMKNKMYDYENLRDESISQRTKIIKFANQLKTMEDQMERIQEFDKKLRVIANLDSPSQPGQISGVGGSSQEDINYRLVLHRRQDLISEELSPKLKKLQSRIKLEEESLLELQGVLRDKRSLLASTPSIWPTKGWVSSVFGYRKSPFTGLKEFHKGLDVATRIGTSVIASADGTIIYAGTKRRYGKMIIVNHGYGYRTYYGHLSEIFVKSGQKVKRGFNVGAVGSSGRSTGPHLHYEVRLNGVPVNPKRYILN